MPRTRCNRASDFLRGGALTNATLVVNGFPFSGITGFGTATGTYFAGAVGQNFTLNLTADIAPRDISTARRPTNTERRAGNMACTPTSRQSDRDFSSILHHL
jgi:hypothetical protein